LIVNLDGRWQVTNLDSAKTDLLPALVKIGAICPYCDSEHAEIKADVFNFAHLTCPQCQRDYFEYPIAPSMFTYKNELLRVEQRTSEFSSMEVLEAEHFRNADEHRFARKVLLNSRDRKFLDDNFQIRRVGSADFSALDYEFRVSENALLFKYPALPVQVQDNAFVNRFLEDMFGGNAEFLRKWMAMYCYTNYLTLPVLVLTGSRGCGKNTFAEMVGAIFPTLMGLWDGDSGNFNEHYRKKLLFVDENPNAEKPTQYVEIKKLTGNKVIKINEKYKPEYYVPNNINVIIATNDPRPMFLKWQEEPKADSVNNFFIYKCPDVSPAKVNNRLGEQLKERLGHYVRTELKTLYEQLAGSQSKANRYTLPAPVTPFARGLFASSKTSVEAEAEELAQYLVCGVDLHDMNHSFGGIHYHPLKASDGTLYAQLKEIRDLIGQLRFKGSQNPKAYINVLQDQGVLSYETNHRVAGKWLGYKVLRSPDYYTTTISGNLSVFE